MNYAKIIIIVAKNKKFTLTSLSLNCVPKTKTEFDIQLKNTALKQFNKHFSSLSLLYIFAPEF